MGPTGGEARAGRRAARPSIGSPVRLASSLVAVALLACALLPLGAATPIRRAASGPTVLDILQGPNRITEHSGMTVSVEISEPSKVHFAYYTFCRLGNAVCYAPPITLLPRAGSDWFVGTTQPMANYTGMVIGEQAGYNITIQYTNNVNVTEPSNPNPFTNLSIAQSVSGEYLFAMTVESNVYDLSGHVYDASTHAPISGASVSIGPAAANQTTSSSGAYTFVGLVNGSYTVTVIKSGYYIGTRSTTISGSNATDDLSLSNTSGPPPSGSSSGGGWGNVLTNPAVIYVVAAVVVAVILLELFVLRRRPRPPAPIAPPSTAPSSPPGSGGS
jgi:hypothetical protein